MLRWLLILLLLFNALGAYYGSYMLLLDPSGEAIQMADGILEGSPFSSFLIPGIILLLVNGLLPTVAAVGMITRKPQKPLPGFPVLKPYHWSWSLALIAGIGLMIWIGVQIAMLGYWKDYPIQGIYGTLGVLITGLALLPGVRKGYRL